MDGPNAVQVYLRAGWSLGNVQDRYLFSGTGTDQLCGRCACGLPLNSLQFGALPPHFADIDILNIENEDWRNILPDYHLYPPSFRTTVPYLLASLVHHWEWLCIHLPVNHPIRQSRVYTNGFIAALSEKVLLGEIKCSVTGLAATGVPNHIIHLKKLIDVENNLEKLDNEMRRSRIEIIEKIDTLNNSLPQTITETLLENFNIEGALPITRDQIEGMIVNMSDAIVIRLQGALGLPPNNNDNNNIPGEEIIIDFMTYNWGGHLQMVPEGWRLPESLPINRMWDLWWYGNRADRIQPYRRLKGFNLSVRVDKVNLSRLKKVIETIVNIAREMNLLQIDQRCESLTLQESADILRVAYHALCMRLYNSNTDVELEQYRIHDKTYNTIYCRLHAR